MVAVSWQPYTFRSFGAPSRGHQPLEILVGAVLVGLMAIFAVLLLQLGRSRSRRPGRGLVTPRTTYSARWTPADQIEPGRRRTLFVVSAGPEQDPAPVPAAGGPVGQPGHAAIADEVKAAEPEAPGSPAAPYAEGPIAQAEPRPGNGRHPPVGRRWLGRAITGLIGDGPDGIPGPAAWERIVTSDGAFLRRYRRPLAVVVAELDGLAELAESFGEEAAERLTVTIGDVFLREARVCDSVAVIGFGRFGAVLPETSEPGAIAFASRVRMLAQPELESAALPVHLAVGCAGAIPPIDMEIVILRAEARLLARLGPRRQLEQLN